MDDQRKSLRQLEETIISKRAEAEKIGSLIEELQVVADDLHSKIREAIFERDRALSSRDKALLEHEQFKKYEAKARIELNKRERMLNNRQVEISTSQSTHTTRSFLAEL